MPVSNSNLLSSKIRCVLKPRLLTRYLPCPSLQFKQLRRIPRPNSNIGDRDSGEVDAARAISLDILQRKCHGTPAEWNGVVLITTGCILNAQDQVAALQISNVSGIAMPLFHCLKRESEDESHESKEKLAYRSVSPNSMPTSGLCPAFGKHVRAATSDVARGMLD
jgi:hypothetical protein